MAKAMTTFCDRCGRPVEDLPENAHNKLKRFDSDYHGTDVDLCTECSKQFKMWLDHPQAAPPGYQWRQKPCPHRIPCADPQGCSGQMLVPL